MRKLRLGLVVLAACVLSLSQSAVAQTIWREGEKPTQAKVQRHPHWYDLVKKAQLSGGDWISHWSDKGPGLVTYDVLVPKENTYAFWLRANPTQSKLAYQLDTGPWTPIDLTSDVMDTVNVAADGKLDLRFVGWKKLGDVKLTRGKHTVRFRMNSDNNNHGAIDAFVFTSEPFLPSGKAKPGQAQAGGDPGTWPFMPQRDAFKKDALLDLSRLNEDVAGQSGFIQLSKDGEGFARGDGEPIRFWAINTYVQRDRSVEDLKHHAKWLAKRGVNMVRLHGHMEPKEEGSKITDIDAKELESAYKLVAAMKDEGIYATISPYWANTPKMFKSWGVEGWPEGKAPHGLLFFHPKVQEGYKAWLKKLFAEKNPHTGIPLGQDPALAIIQIQNEDSMLFWTIQGLEGQPLMMLREQFADWVNKKYGSYEKAMSAWENYAHPDDDAKKGIPGFFIVWEYTGGALKEKGGAPGREQRLSDQLQFTAELMHNFHAEIARYLREDLGCKQLINAGNWYPAETIRLMDVERWSYTANEVTGRNFYYDGGVHIGPDRGWRINKGDQFTEKSGTKNPRGLPFNSKTVVGHPHLVPETLWVPPLGYQSEGPFLASAYTSLNGVDVLYWFATGETEWASQDRAEWDAASRGKWLLATPMIMGQFPAAALAFRKGYIEEGEPVVVEHRSLEQLWRRVPPVIAEDASYDPNRDLGDAPQRLNLEGGVDPLAFLVGPVRVVYDSDPSQTQIGEVEKYIDHSKNLVTSNTGQIKLDYGTGVCVVDAPKAQGVSGFLKEAGGKFELTDVTIGSENNYATVSVVALDEKPLKESGKVLVQVGTIARPTGWKTEDASFQNDEKTETYQGKKIVDNGRMPWAVRDAKVTVTVKNPSLKKATLLDVNGNPLREVQSTTEGGALQVELPRDTLYVVLQG